MTQKISEIKRVAFVGNYLPRKCGIATFTSDVCGAVVSQYSQTHCFVVPVNDIEGGYAYPKEVRFEIEEQSLSSYQRAADFLNINDVDAVCVQHEFGIYGGAAGGHLLALLRDLKAPIVTTLHTVLRDPTRDQRRVMAELLRLSTRLVAMTQTGEGLLREVYNVPAEKIDLIPHGIPDMPFVDPNFYKDLFGVEGKLVLLTFGLLAPNKGVEHALNAMPEILRGFSNVVYIILGATHPNLLKTEGETYRLRLERLAKKNKIQKNVIFYNQFVELEELKEFIGAADIYLTPYLNEAQITSGTLAYAFGAGKAVVSTPYWHAAELLAENRGVLVPFGDARAIAREVVQLLSDEPRRHAIRKNAYKMGREMVWSHVAHLYMQSFAKARLDHNFLSRKPVIIKTLDERQGQLPEFKLDHLFRMSDSTGVFQHAVFTVPNFSHGYCLDDNARALILAILLNQLGQSTAQLQSMAATCAAFIHHAYDAKMRQFRNFLGFERRWLEEKGADDSHGRALWALGTCVGRFPNSGFQTLAGQLFAKALPRILELSSPRAWALALIGIHEYLQRLGGDRIATQARETLVSRLMDLQQRVAAPDWPWFEDSLTYNNARLPHALILSGKAMNQPACVEAGLKSLRWLLEIQISKNGCFHPVGSNGFYERGKAMAQFDQQPIEAYSCLSACLEAFRATADDFWFEQAWVVFDWFFGLNDLGAPLYDSNTGGCCDALHVDRVNQNQGAESTLVFLLSLAEMALQQNEMAALKNPA
ncbi:MAG: glycosyltransferase family 4 protein [Verrucomicrobiae bacterium]|nr:glycosyltransferase family 4 protein [Verrucomicrobiae bacterium]